MNLQGGTWVEREPAPISNFAPFGELDLNFRASRLEQSRDARLVSSSIEHR
jgi:hypothetical protein